MKLSQWMVLGGVVGTGAYWLTRYLQPEESPATLNGSVVVITGASSGIGWAYAEAFARHGARVVIAARRADRLQALQDRILPYATDVLAIPTDVSDNEQLKNLVEQTLSHFGHIDVLVNNAGISTDGLLHQVPIDTNSKLMTVNLLAAMNLTSLCLPSMLAQRSGHIINVASAAGKIATPGSIPYTTSKFALIAFSDVLRREVVSKGIYVTSVLPTFTVSEMVGPEAQAQVRARGLSVDSAEYVADRTIQGMLKHTSDIYFGQPFIRFAIWLERHFPAVVSWITRYIVTSEMITNMQADSERDRQLRAR